MLNRKNLQERVVAVVLAVKDSWSSSVTPRFLAVQARDTTTFSMLMKRSWMGDCLPGRKSSSVMSRQMSSRPTEICAATWVEIKENRATLHVVQSSEVTRFKHRFSSKYPASVVLEVGCELGEYRP